jgi:hypothetical protein
VQRVDLLELLNKGEKGVHCVAPKENLRKQKSVVNTQSTYHRDALTPLIWHLNLHSSFYPHSGRLHPEVESCLIYVDDVGVRLIHDCHCDLRGELLLLVQQLTFPFRLGSIDNLGFPIGGPMFYIYLSD